LFIFIQYLGKNYYYVGNQKGFSFRFEHKSWGAYNTFKHYLMHGHNTYFGCLGQETTIMQTGVVTRRQTKSV